MDSHTCHVSNPQDGKRSSFYYFTVVNVYTPELGALAPRAAYIRAAGAPLLHHSWCDRCVLVVWVCHAFVCVLRCARCVLPLFSMSCGMPDASLWFACVMPLFVCVLRCARCFLRCARCVLVVCLCHAFVCVCFAVAALSLQSAVRPPFVKEMLAYTPVYCWRGRSLSLGNQIASHALNASLYATFELRCCGAIPARHWGSDGVSLIS